jgi:hypothetical protein
MPIPKGTWINITMDFIERLLEVREKDTILMIVNMFTKYGHYTYIYTFFNNSIDNTGVPRPFLQTTWVASNYCHR